MFDWKSLCSFRSSPILVSEFRHRFDYSPQFSDILRSPSLTSVISGTIVRKAHPRFGGFWSDNSNAADQLVDFSVEVYTPETTLVTVLSGQVIVKTLNGEQKRVPSCHNLLIEEGKNTSDLLAVPPDDIKRLAEQTTIPGTIVATPHECNIPATAETTVNTTADFGA